MDVKDIYGLPDTEEMSYGDDDMLSREGLQRYQTERSDNGEMDVVGYLPWMRK